MFCPKCKSLMFPQGGKFACRSCGNEGDANGAPVQTVTESGVEKVIPILEEKDDVRPTIRVECPKCSHNEAYWMLRQTRSADEAETRFYTCTKCDHRWREYS